MLIFVQNIETFILYSSLGVKNYFGIYGPNLKEPERLIGFSGINVYNSFALAACYLTM